MRRSSWIVQPSAISWRLATFSREHSARAARGKPAMIKTAKTIYFVTGQDTSTAPRTRQRPGSTMMKPNKNVAASVAVALLLIAAVARAAADEKTITGVISGVNAATRIATITPAGGKPIVVQFA